MTTISPTRVSMYDFLYQDTQPMMSLLADTAQLSLPQTRIALAASLQAIVAALLAYQQHYQGQAVNKKLFTRGSIKELRKYHAMNFTTMYSILYCRNEVATVIFFDNARVLKASAYIAAQVDATTSQIQTLLSSLCVLVLRELAILADYGKLDNNELDKWFALQPQFLSAKRFEDTPTTDAFLVPPPFDTYWYELTRFQPQQTVPVQDMQQATSNYLKAIGRSPENTQQGRHNDILIFATLSTITLPHQRWLLQLAKISDIYLSRNRLRITSEPDKPPAPPLVSFALMNGNENHTPATISEKPIEYDTPRPLWRDPAILIIILVIGILGALALLKYQLQKSDTEAHMDQAAHSESQNDVRQQQDVAIVKVEDNDINDGNVVENTP